VLALPDGPATGTTSSPTPPSTAPLPGARSSCPLPVRAARPSRRGGSRRADFAVWAPSATGSGAARRRPARR
jgi:hypothetical protein